MAVSGAKPKPPGEAIPRGQRPVFEWTEVEDIPFTGGPDLPTLRYNDEKWPSRCRAKWRAWRRMPHAKLWTEADWDFAYDTIEVAARFYKGAGVTTAMELRQRENLMGTTMDARRDLRIRYIDPKPPKLAAVVNADDFRDL